MSSEQSWDEMEASQGIPQHPQRVRGYSAVFEPGDVVRFPEHLDERVHHVDYTVGLVHSQSMTVGGVEGYQEIPDHRLTSWGMVHSPEHWRTVAQQQAVRANEVCRSGLTVVPGIELGCRKEPGHEGMHGNSWYAWGPHEQCAAVEPVSGLHCIATGPHLRHRSWDLAANAVGDEWPEGEQ